MRRVLIVSPHFPPVNAPDMQRVRMSLPYFRESGWEPTVLAVDAASVEGSRDPLLADTVPSDVSIHRVGALPARWTRLAGLGNIAYRAWFQLDAAGRRLLRETRFDLVYFSTTQFVATALGARWHRRFGVPFVIDVQDPWRTDYYERPGAPRPPGGWKYRFARWQAARLEEPSWCDAAGFISVSDRYLDQLRARYPWFAAKPAATIPFGAPEADFEYVRHHPAVAPAFTREPGMIHLVSVGAAGPIMRRALERLFTGMREFGTRSPEILARLRFHFIGTSYAPSGREMPSVRPMAEAGGVAEWVHEQPERVGYFTAIRTMLDADAILILGSDDPAYSPSKAAACFLAGKPVLTIAPAGSLLAQAMREPGRGALAVFPPPAGDDAVEQFLRALASNPAPTSSATPISAQFLEADSARTRTRQQCEFFDRALVANS